MKNIIIKAYTTLDIAIVRYLIMAVFIVGIELISFIVLNSILNIYYLYASILSMVISIVLNWLFSKVFVFKKSKYSNSVEFGLVLVVSVVGMLIQSAVIYVSVEILTLVPLIGKILAIIITFFWNFWVRSKYIFN